MTRFTTRTILEEKKNVGILGIIMNSPLLFISIVGIIIIMCLSNVYSNPVSGFNGVDFEISKLKAAKINEKTIVTERTPSSTTTYKPYTPKFQGMSDTTWTWLIVSVVFILIIMVLMAVAYIRSQDR